MNIPRAVWILLLVVSCVLVGCAQTVSTLPPNAPDPTTYVRVTYGDPLTLDPALDYEGAGATILLNTYDRLIAFNKSDPTSYVPELAIEVPSVENGGISADGVTYTFNMGEW